MSEVSTAFERRGPFRATSHRRPRSVASVSTSVRPRSVVALLLDPDSFFVEDVFSRRCWAADLPCRRVVRHRGWPPSTVARRVP